MSLSGSETFEVEPLSMNAIPGNTSILLTGDDTEALEAIFYRLVAAPDDEQSIVLATESDGQSTKRALKNAVRGADKRTSILTCEGTARGDDVTSVEDMSDLTRVGMDFSGLFAEAQQEPRPLRAGILLCSTIMGEIDDTRSVYRFLNSNFLSPLRRSKALGVCAIDTDADIGADINSTIVGLETSFGARVHVETTGRKQATLDVSGLSNNDGTVEVSW